MLFIMYMYWNVNMYVKLYGIYIDDCLIDSFSILIANNCSYYMESVILCINQSYCAWIYEYKAYPYMHLLTNFLYESALLLAFQFLM